jgi:hypothetical protein
MKLSAAQLDMLLAAAKTSDGSVLGHGFSHGRHAISTGKALERRGLLRLAQVKASYNIYRLTEDGRRCLEERGR